MSTYFAILTAVGEAKRANAELLGSVVQITDMVVGDGNGVTPVPNRLQTALANEVRRAPINTLDENPADPSQIVVEQVIPENVGGWWIREFGLIDADGDLVAIANAPATYKPLLAEGSGRTQVLRMVLIWGSSATVQLKIDPAVVLATRKYSDDGDALIAQALADHLSATDPHAQYATKTGVQHQTYTAFTTGGAAPNFTLAASPAISAYAAGQRFRVKFASNGTGNDFLNISGLGNKSLKQYDKNGAKVPASIKANQLCDIEYDGEHLVLLTPLPQTVDEATADIKGIVELATDLEAQAFAAGKVIDGALLAAAFGGANRSLTASGYQKLPGGLIVQWGEISFSSGIVSAAYPVAFPNSVLIVIPCDRSTGAASISACWRPDLSNNAMVTLYTGDGAMAGAYGYVAIGF